MLPVCMMVMMLYLQCGRLCNALHIAQMHHLQVEYGEWVTLPCNASAYLEEEEGGPWWEAMGEDVAILQGEEVIQPDRFNGRFHLPSEELRREGHWSLVLSYALLSDTNMYECIWKGKKTISTVWLTVNLPHVERSMSVPVDDLLTLPCYIPMSRKQSPNNMLVWWTWNGMTIASLPGSVPSMDDYRRRIFPDSRESFELDISPTMMTDSGEYQCLYKTSDADDAKPGTPESITLTVVETNTTDIANLSDTPWVVTTDETTGTTEDWVSTTHWPIVSTTEEVTVTDPIHVLEDSTQPIEAAPDNVPWVRYGLIAAVLLLTAVVLCILKAAQRI
ncbi:Protein borderless [Dissostichus eleginoides]|uniref:Protein borderless n=1 Tax=Dissostichus eleginoides TaxID=100907 RepID=A0AAD9ETJ7_DISEL|nr:Protein borderless [Dissostichus eleginoides]